MVKTFRNNDDADKEDLTGYITPYIFSPEEAASASAKLVTVKN